jgi:hypothetical protein
MADAVDVQYIFTGTRRVKVKLTNISDGTGEAAVIKVNISDLIGPNGQAPTRTVVENVEAMVQGFTSVHLFWDHTTDDEISILGTGYSYFDWADVGGFTDPASTGGTGDIVLTTVGATATATYDIVLTLRLKD